MSDQPSQTLGDDASATKPIWFRSGLVRSSSMMDFARRRSRHRRDAGTRRDRRGTSSAVATGMSNTNEGFPRRSSQEFAEAPVGAGGARLGEEDHLAWVGFSSNFVQSVESITMAETMAARSMFHNRGEIVAPRRGTGIAAGQRARRGGGPRLSQAISSRERDSAPVSRPTQGRASRNRSNGDLLANGRRINPRCEGCLAE